MVLYGFLVRAGAAEYAGRIMSRGGSRAFSIMIRTRARGQLVGGIVFRLKKSIRLKKRRKKSDIGCTSNIFQRREEHRVTHPKNFISR